MRAFKKITAYTDIEKFHKMFSKKIKYEVPITYLTKGVCYGFYKNNSLVGGFCLIHDFPLNLRSFQQIHGAIDTEALVKAGMTILNTADFTGYFLTDKSSGLYFTYHLVKTIFNHKAARFIYSYPVSQVALERYYSKGHPVRLYTGKPKFLPGHEHNMEEEHVEVLSKWGIFKIFVSRTVKYLLKSKR